MGGMGWDGEKERLRKSNHQASREAGREAGDRLLLHLKPARHETVIQISLLLPSLPSIASWFKWL